LLAFKQKIQEQSLEAEFSQSEKEVSVNSLMLWQSRHGLLKEQAELISTESSPKDEGKSRRVCIEPFYERKFGLAIYQHPKRMKRHFSSKPAPSRMYCLQQLEFGSAEKIPLVPNFESLGSAKSRYKTLYSLLPQQKSKTQLHERL
jgi:hypothetical protein